MATEAPESVKKADQRKERVARPTSHDFRVSPYKKLSLRELYSLASDRNLKHCRTGLAVLRKRNQKSIIIRMLRRQDILINPYLGWKVADLKLFVRQKSITTRGLRHKQDLINALTTSDTKRPYHFLELPAEVRIMIYEHAITEENKHESPILDVPRKQPPLLTVCRQIRQEMLPLYYGSIHFPVTFSWVTDFFSTPMRTNSVIAPATRAFLAGLQASDPVGLSQVRFLKVVITTDLNYFLKRTWVFEIDLKKPLSDQADHLGGREFAVGSCLCGSCYSSGDMSLRRQAMAIFRPHLGGVLSNAAAGRLSAGDIESLDEWLGDAIINGGIV